jgi:hypothetical protein
MFHQIQRFCASTRPGLNFPDGLRALGLQHPSALMEEIVQSEFGHGTDLAVMAGHIVNRSNADTIFTDIRDCARVELGLKFYSDSIFGNFPGYDRGTGLLPQAAAAIAVFERRSRLDENATWKNLGTAFALEIISNQSLIPGEKHALVDSGHYGTTLEDPSMHYLADHWGEAGAEQSHENNVMEAVAMVLNDKNEKLILQGADDFLESLAKLWDVLDAALLQSGVDNPKTMLSQYIEVPVLALRNAGVAADAARSS